MEKEIKITPPEGYEIDKDNSTFECIKFKPVQEKRWRDNTDALITGFYIDEGADIKSSGYCSNEPRDYNVFATEKQAKSALAMARISQIIANDERFGGTVTDEEWKDRNIIKYTFKREEYHISKDYYYAFYHFLAFHTAEQRDLFLEENEDLVRDYLML